LHFRVIRFGRVRQYGYCDDKSHTANRTRRMPDKNVAELLRLQEPFRIRLLAIVLSGVLSHIAGKRLF
jgi:hypothetical protein